MSKRAYYMMLSAIIGVPGLALLASVDWRIAVGIFLFVWGNNILEKK